MPDRRRAEPDPIGGAQRVSGSALSWAPIPETFRNANRSLPQPWEDMFGPLRHGVIDHLVVIAQCGQSIDARVATASGHSHYINGEAGLVHLHRLRALVDGAQLATRELGALGLADPSKVEKGYVTRVPLAYPMYDADYAERVQTIRDWPCDASRDPTLHASSWIRTVGCRRPRAYCRPTVPGELS